MTVFWVLNETVLLRTHNICFGLEIRKIIFSFALLSGGLVYKGLMKYKPISLYFLILILLAVSYFLDEKNKAKQCG